MTRTRAKRRENDATPEDVGRQWTCVWASTSELSGVTSSIQGGVQVQFRKR